MSTDLSTAQYPEATGRVDIVFSQPTVTMRWNEATTECRHIEALFLLVDDARDAHIKQLLNVFPHLKDKKRVVRYANVKLDQHYSENFSRYPDARDKNRTRPRFGQLFRVETRFTSVGNTSVKFQHRFLTVPLSQAKRDFNNRDEDEQYAALDEDEEPERLFASAEGAIVFIKWQTDEKGHRFFRPTPGVFQNAALAAPPTIQFLKEKAPEKRPAGSLRPENAFRVHIHLRKSDEDELGHVTNSRYVSLIHDVLTYGLRTGYYANGAGLSKTATDLPAIPSHTNSTGLDVAVPAGSPFYKRGTVYEVYVGYERELKVQPEVYVWSWVERSKIQDEFDVVRFEICAPDNNGQEQVLSLCRAIVKEDPHQRAML
ncbi:hypothetical protein BC939DRAFT_444718 [Gamsiella multidivaricata]|uniref:uncharacterized protein n=1 Tax=Gamsiella multidivaricata TaxID=101098 RepID=UPI00221E5ABA|nr:uncharacterized protein BC939DRAFT_444718 [Gamsiella multidivaricata]KAG0358494.1 hypothetical protein BGZ54_010398 [Gamsiella multidivaricata]KAI7827594.1 hypothetical protein BC939DRAFT_444718 [Gamsiella multidivaricata]